MKLRRDRLIELIAILRDGKLYRACDLADRLQVSVRSLYRDMDTLVQSGVPVRGERGSGYQMTAAVTLPPLNLTLAELEALHLGVAVMAEAADPDLRDAGRALATKLDQALPEDAPPRADTFGLAGYPFADPAAGVRHIPQLRAAIRTHTKLHIKITEPQKPPMQTIIHPLKLDFWGRVWTCRAWNETTGEMTDLRLDQIANLVDTTVSFQDQMPQHLTGMTSAFPR